MTFLMMLPVILPSMLMIIVSTLSLIRNLELEQQLELTAEFESDLWQKVAC